MISLRSKFQFSVRKTNRYCDSCQGLGENIFQKVEKFLILVWIQSHYLHLSVKIQLMGGKVRLRREGKTLLDVVNKSFLT